MKLSLLLLTHVKASLLNKKAQFKALRLHEQIYASSMAGFLTITLALAAFPGARQVLSALLVVASHGFLIGVIFWALPIVQAKWQTALGTLTKVILHVIAILTATAFARYQVSMAMGLPAQDFDLTVSFVALLLYLPALALILSLLLAPSFLVGFPLLLVAVGLKKEQQDRRLMTGMAHLIGAVGISMYAGQFFHWSAQERPIFHSAIRLLAVLADYQPASLYPGVKKGQHIRLHENGVVSAIEVTKEGVAVRVWQLEQ